MAAPLTFNPFRAAFGVVEDPPRPAPPARRRVGPRSHEGSGRPSIAATRVGAAPDATDARRGPRRPPRPGERAGAEPCGRPGSEGPRSGLRSASPLGGGGAKRAAGGAGRTLVVAVVYRRPFRTPSEERPL